MSDSFEGAADTAMEHAAADAAAGLTARTGGGDSQCGNCGAVLTGEFCHQCGQSAQSLRRPFWALLGESLETLFAIDGRIARTLPNLMFRPGRMTRAYLDGQRARFIPPFRLYVLASLLFFVLLPLVMGQGISLTPNATVNAEEARAQAEQAYAAGEMTEEQYRSTLAGIAELEAFLAGNADTGQPISPEVPSDTPTPAETSEDSEAPPVPAEVVSELRKASAAGDPNAAMLTRVIDNPDQLAQRTQEWIPRLMFVLLPVYACLLALVYLWRRKFFFYDHLIVSLHFHSALFFAMALGMLLAYLIGAGWVWLALLIYSNWYLYRLNRAVYERGRLSSMLRVLTLDTVYFVILMSALLIAVVLGALSL